LRFCNSLKQIDIGGKGLLGYDGGSFITTNQGENTMEFLILVLLAISILLLLIRPENEKLVFFIFLCGALLNCFMYFVASFNSVLPSGNF
jgi:hypothetical protein